MAQLFVISLWNVAITKKGLAKRKMVHGMKINLLHSSKYRIKMRLGQHHNRCLKDAPLYPKCFEEFNSLRAFMMISM